MSTPTFTSEQQMLLVSALIEAIETSVAFERQFRGTPNNTPFSGAFLACCSLMGVICPEANEQERKTQLDSIVRTALQQSHMHSTNVH